MKRLHKTQSSRRKPPTLWSVISVTIFSVVVSLLAIIVLAVVIVPKLIGGTSYTILTSSMEPGLPPGTIVVTQPRQFDEIRVGDVVTYQLNSGEPEVVTHRVVGINKDARGVSSLTLRGDNNTDNDPQPVIREQVRGVLIYAVPVVGLVIEGVGDNVQSQLPAVIGLAFLIWGLWYCVSYLISRRRKRKEGANT